MIQFAIVLIINRRCYNANKIIYIENKINVVEVYGLQLREKTENEGMLKTKGAVYSRTEKIDLSALFWFLAFYSIFNMIYFLHYLDLP